MIKFICSLVIIFMIALMYYIFDRVKLIDALEKKAKKLEDDSK